MDENIIPISGVLGDILLKRERSLRSSIRRVTKVEFIKILREQGITPGQINAHLLILNSDSGGNIYYDSASGQNLQLLA